jgi:hypothetical protein
LGSGTTSWRMVAQGMCHVLYELPPSSRHRDIDLQRFINATASQCRMPGPSGCASRGLYCLRSLLRSMLDCKHRICARHM